MNARPTLDDVMPAALEMLDLAARNAPSDEAAAPALRLGRGTREGQAHVNLLLAAAFAGVLEAECPDQWRTAEGVPDVKALHEIDEDPAGEAHVYIGVKAAEGQEVSLADAKARLAQHSSATDLAMLYLRYRRLEPAQLDAFVDGARRTLPRAVGQMWGALFIACGTLRAMNPHERT